MNLNTEGWIEFQICKMFIIHPTKAYKGMSKDDITDGGNTPLVVNSAVNNGIGGFSTLEATEKSGIITFSDTTEGNTFFYQPHDFIGFAHVQGMYPIDRTWTKNECLFLTTMLTFVNSWRYSYGRKMSRENILQSKVLLPVIKTKEPNWKFMNQYIDSLHNRIITTTKTLRNTSALNTHNWKEFFLTKLFYLSRGNGLSKSNLMDDKEGINFVSRQSYDNGVNGIVARISEIEPFDEGCITIALGGEYLGSSFIQLKPFYTAAHMAILKPKTEMSLYMKLFITRLIRLESSYKYQAFGRELDTHIDKEFTIKLPIQMDKGKAVIDKKCEFSDDGYIPDWKWMEEYMKTLPYSDRITC